VAENYPELKANQNFLSLQNELANTEDRIQASRRFYNANVQSYNRRVQAFPSNILARRFRFKEEEFFEIPDSLRPVVEVAPRVDFSAPASSPAPPPAAPAAPGSAAPGEESAGPPP
jgi:LemA protein